MVNERRPLPSFREMDPEVTLKLLEGHKDILTPMAAREEDAARSFSCPRCGGSACDLVVDRDRPFTSGSILPNRSMRCRGCRTEVDPRSGIVLRFTGEPG